MKRPWDSIVWWEIRRILFNLAVGICGGISVFIVELIGSHYVKSGEDVIEPPALIVSIIVYGIAMNTLYTLGWITEIIWTCGDTSLTEKIRLKVFLVGTILSCLVTLVPAILIPLAWAIIGFK